MTSEARSRRRRKSEPVRVRFSALRWGRLRADGLLRQPGVARHSSRAASTLNSTGFDRIYWVATGKTYGLALLASRAVPGRSQWRDGSERAGLHRGWFRPDTISDETESSQTIISALFDLVPPERLCRWRNKSHALPGGLLRFPKKTYLYRQIFIF